MAVNPCPTFIPCKPCADGNPFQNRSAEAPDPADFFSFQFVQEIPPLGGLDNWWAGTAIPGSCFASTQQAADDCARRNGFEDIVDEWRDRNGIPLPIFGNTPQTCTINCGDGFQPFVYTVPAGTVVAFTQEEADAIAASFCQARALENKVCVPNIQPITISVVDVASINDLSNNGIIAVRLNTGFSGYFYNGSLVTLGLQPGTTFAECFACNSSFHFASENFKGGGGSFDRGIWETVAAQEVMGSTPATLPAVANSSRRISEDDIAVCFQGLYDHKIATFLPGASFGAGIPVARVSSIGGSGSTHYLAAYSHSLAAPDPRLYRYTYETNTLQEITPAGSDSSNFAATADITSAGHICGYYFVAGVLKSFFNKSGGIANTVDLGNLGGNVGANALNESDVVVGDAASGGQVVPFKWTQGAGITAIPLLGGTISGSAKDINAGGDIVGNMNTALAVSIAFLNRNGTTYRLFDLIPSDQKSLWTSLETATLINDNKQIVGFGTYNGVTKGYIMRVPTGSI